MIDISLIFHAFDFFHFRRHADYFRHVTTRDMANAQQRRAAFSLPLMLKHGVFRFAAATLRCCFAAAAAAVFHTFTMALIIALMPALIAIAVMSRAIPDITLTTYYMML